MEKWICSCGEENEGNFCIKCGKRREEAAGGTVSENTMQMPVVSQQHMQPVAPPPINNYQYQPSYEVPVQQGGFFNRIGKGPLIGIVAVLVIAIFGMVGYFSGIESRYMNKVKDADNLTAEIHTLLSEVHSLDGDPDSDATKKYISKYEDLSKRFDDLTVDIKDAKVPKKYTDYNVSLVDAMEMEGQILKSVHDVLVNTPDNGKYPATVSNDFQTSVTNLVNKSSDLSMDEVQLDRNMNLSKLVQDVNAYLVRYHNVAEQKRIEAERKARMEALQRLDTFRRGLKESFDDKRRDARSTRSGIYLANNVTCYDEKLTIEGDFYNGSNRSGSYINGLSMHVVLYNQGEVVRDISSHFGYVYLGTLYPYGSVYHKFNIYDSSITENLIFDSFDVTVNF